MLKKNLNSLILIFRERERERGEKEERKEGSKDGREERREISVCCSPYI